jgi:triphosphatase
VVAIASKTELSVMIRPGDLPARKRASAVRAKHRSIAAAHAEPPALDPVLSGDAALRQIGLASLDHISRNEPAVLAGIDEGIHQMRVAVRRLRATLSAFAKLLPEEHRQWASDELRWLADALGAARNLDVFETALLKPAQRASVDPRALEPLRRAAVRQRRAAHHTAANAVRSARYAALMLHLFRWFDACGWRGEGAEGSEKPIGGVAARALQHRWRVAKKRGKGFAVQSVRQRHRLRIALKKLRYTAESLSALYPRNNTDRFTTRLKRLQDDLGHANDVRVGYDILAALASNARRGKAVAKAGKRMLGWHERRLAHSEPKLRKHVRALFKSEPFWHP